MWLPPARKVTREHAREGGIKRPDQDFIPLRELASVSGYDADDLQELLCVEIFIEDENEHVPGILVHAEAPNCPPGCYRIFDQTTYRFTSSWTVAREDQELFPGQAQKAYERGIKDMGEYAKPDAASALLKDQTFQNRSVFSGPGVFRSVSTMKDFLATHLKEVSETEAPADACAPMMISVDAAACSAARPGNEDILGASEGHSMTFGFSAAARKAAAADAKDTVIQPKAKQPKSVHAISTCRKATPKQFGLDQEVVATATPNVQRIMPALAVGAPPTSTTIRR